MAPPHKDEIRHKRKNVYWNATKRRFRELQTIIYKNRSQSGKIWKRHQHNLVMWPIRCFLDEHAARNSENDNNNSPVQCWLCPAEVTEPPRFITATSRLNKVCNTRPLVCAAVCFHFGQISVHPQCHPLKLHRAPTGMCFTAFSCIFRNFMWTKTRREFRPEFLKLKKKNFVFVWTGP